MSELRIHAVNKRDSSVVLCGQIKMRDHSRKHGLRYTAELTDVTCSKCIAKLVERHADR